MIFISRSSRVGSIALLAVLAVGFAALGHSVQARHAGAATGVGTIAIDTNTTGNTVTPCAAYPCNNSTTLGAIDGCRSINVGDVITIDVVGISIPPGGAAGSNLGEAGASGSDGSLQWTPNGPTGPIEMTAKDFSVALIHQGPGDNASTSTNPSLPDNTGVWNWSDTDINPNLAGEGGPGIAARISIKGINAGIANLTLQPNTLSQTNWFDVPTNEYSVGSNGTATIKVGQPCTPFTDLAATAATVSAPPTESAGTAFDVVAGGAVQNNGPVSPVNADASVTLMMPPDCTADGSAQHTIQGLTLNQGVPVTLPDQTFSVTCSSPSFHAFSNTVSVTPDDPNATESASGNNQMSAPTSTTAVIATSDVALQSVAISSDAAATPTPMAGITFNVNAALTVGNSGPFGPTGVSGSATLSAPADCLIVTSLAPNPAYFSGSIPAGTAQTINVSWTVRCNNPGDHTFNASAAVAPSDLHVIDAPGNNSNSGQGTATLKVGACGADPHPAGDPIQNLSPQLLLLIQSLTATGTPVADNLKYQMDCSFSMTLRDQMNTPGDYCLVQPSHGSSVLAGPGTEHRHPRRIPGQRADRPLEPRRRIVLARGV